MSRLKHRFRVYDILTLLGLILIAAWAPAYMAQEPAERHAASGLVIQTSPPRYGDEITYTFIVRHNDLPAVSTGHTYTIRYQRPTPEDDARGVIVNVTHILHPRHLDLGFATFLQDPQYEHRLYGRHGQRIGGVTERLFDPADRLPTLHGDTRTMPLHARLSGTTDGIPDLRRVFELEYLPTTDLQRILDHYMPVERSEPAPDPGAPASDSISIPPQEVLRIAPIAALHQDRVLLARFPQEFGIVGGMSQADRDRDDIIMFQHEDRSFRFEWHTSEDMPRGQRIGWEWFAADLPIIAGRHNSLRNSQGEITTTIDLVVSEYTQGDMPIPVRPYTGESGVGPSAPGSRPAPSLQTESHPFHRDVSGATLRNWLLEPRNDQPSRTLMQEGGWILGFAWNQSHADDEASWFVTVVHPNGTTTNTLLHIQQGAPVSWRTVCYERIDFARAVLRGTCKQEHKGLLANVPEVLPPHIVFGKMRGNASAPVASSGAYMPSLMHEMDFREGGPAGSDHGFNPFFHSFLTRSPSGSAATHERSYASLATLYGDTFRYTSIDLTTGSPVATESFVPADTSWTAHRAEVIPAAAATPVQRIEPLGRDAAYGGLALIAIGILVRLLAAVKSGAHLPVFAALYAKISKDHALDHEHREAIHGLVQADPGVRIGEVAQATGLSRTAAFHHLRTLERNDLVKVTTLGRMRHYFPAEMADPKARLRGAVQRHPEWEAVMRHMEAHPGVTVKQAADALDRSKTSLSRIGTRLERLGLLEKRRDGRQVRLYPLTPHASPPSSPPSS